MSFTLSQLELKFDLILHFEDLLVEFEEKMIVFGAVEGLLSILVGGLMRNLGLGLLLMRGWLLLENLIKKSRLEV